MRRYLLTLLKNGLPTAAILAILGSGLAQFAGICYASAAGGRGSSVGATEIARAFEWRLPLMMAAWGFGLVALFEGVLALLRKPVPAQHPVAIVDETEQLLLKLLEEADVAEAERQMKMALAQTPMPKGLAERQVVEVADSGSSTRPRGRAESAQAP
jgi:hypothetical protein